MDQVIPKVTIPVDPANVIPLRPGDRPIRVGGVRLRTTIYVVTAAEITGGNQNVAAISVPLNEAVELSFVGEEK